MFWQPRSILQLLLLGFFTVVAPLSVAIALTVQTLMGQAASNAALNQRTITLTRATQQLQSDLLDLERRARQYATLKDPHLLGLVMEGFDDLQLSLTVILARLDSQSAPEAVTLNDQLLALQHILSQAEQQPDLLEPVLELFDAISLQGRRIEQASREQVDRELAAQLAAADETSTTVQVMVAALALLTLLVALLFSYWINRPIQQLERVIRQLGSGRGDQSARIQGPRELQLLGQQLDWLRDQLLALDSQKQQFLRHISHELKTPLASLREGADLLGEGVVGPQLNAAQNEIVSIIQQNSQELQRLIENLLDYNQLNRHQSAQREPVKIPDLIGEVMATHRLGVQRRQLRISLQGGEMVWWVDASKLRAALDNLISNLVSYAAEGSHARIRWLCDRDQLVIDVANRGKAIEEDEAERVFEPFFQGRSRRRGAIKGSGIGLSVARECIQSQGGALGLVAVKGFDVCFRIRLPRLEEEQ